jgi:hypothetical protein
MRGIGKLNLGKAAYLIRCTVTSFTCLLICAMVSNHCIAVELELRTSGMVC